MRIGVAIPCYIGHINQLQVLLESISNQTRLPDKVVVSCSSTTEFPDVPKYNFDLTIVCDPTRKNTAQNRNIAAQLLDTDIITFFDADDVMHPQRIEFIEQAFWEGADIVLHNFETESSKFTLYDSCNISYNSLRQCESGCIRHIIWNAHDRIHHSQVSVKRELYDIVKCDEREEVVTREDCIFCWSVFACPNVTNAYISNKLSFYVASGSLAK